MAIPTYSVGVMIAPLEQEFGWSRAQISSGLTLISVMSICLGSLMGIFVDRFGPRRIAITAAMLMCSAIALLSTANANIWLWWGLWMLIGLACAMSPTLWPGAVSSLFVKSRGLALGITLSGSSLGATLVPIMGHYFLEQYGWRGAYLGLAICWGLFSLPLIILFFHSAMDKAKTANKTEQVATELFGPTAKEGLRSVSFIKLATASLAISLPGVALIVNMIPIMQSTGIDTGVAATIAGALGIASIIGRVLGGVMLDKISAKAIAVATTLATGILPVMLIVFPGSTLAATVGVIVLGFSVGGKLGAMTYLASRFFGTRSFGVLFGTMSALIGLGAGVGPLLANLVYDSLQSYEVVLWGTLPILLIAALIFLSLGKYPDFTKSNSPDDHKNIKHSEKESGLIRKSLSPTVNSSNIRENPV